MSASSNTLSYVSNGGTLGGNPNRLLINSNRDIVLTAPNGGIYATSSEGGTSPHTNSQNLVVTNGPFGIRFTPSSKIIKDNIQDINKESLFQFLDKVSIKSFNYKDSSETQAFSVIIEDEQEKNTPFIDTLTRRNRHVSRYDSIDDIPDYLLPFINDKDIIEEKEGRYYYSPLEIDSVSISYLSLALIQELKKENELLKEEINEIKKQLDKNENQ